MGVPKPRLTLVGKPGCHLCDDAREIVTAVAGEFDALELVEESILDDAALHERFVNDIPVVLIDDRVHARWRVKPEKLRQALSEAGA